MLTKEIIKILEKREFVSVATCDFDGRPNAAPKFLLRVDGDTIYLVDYSIGMTWQNIKINPRVSLSFIDNSTLQGYQLNGPVRLVDKGAEFKKLCNEMQDKTIRLTAQHIIEEVRGGSKHESFELIIPDKIVIFEVRVDSVAWIGIRGDIKRSKKREGARAR